MKLITTALLLILSANVFAQTQGALENPSQGSYTSGIYMFSGWACDADLIEIVINGSSGIKAAYGTDRGDTRGICGDSDNGFGLLFNMANIGTGEHTAVAFADGLEIGRSTFNVKRMTSGEFLRGQTAETVVKNFPSSGQEVKFTWVESAQNFLVSDEYVSPNPYDIAGVWGGAGFVAASLHTTIIPGNPLVQIASSLLEDSTGQTYLMFGEMRAGVIEMQTVDEFHPDFDISVRITFPSATEAVVELVDCMPISYCWGPIGSTAPMGKAL